MDFDKKRFSPLNQHVDGRPSIWRMQGGCV